MPSCNVKTAARLDVQEDQRDQGQERAQQGVQEKLEGCINLVGAAPYTNDQVHGNQRGFKEHVEQQAV